MDLVNEVTDLNVSAYLLVFSCYVQRPCFHTKGCYYLLLCRSIDFTTDL